MYDWTDFQWTRFGRYAYRWIPCLHRDRLLDGGEPAKVTELLWSYTPFDGEISFDREIRDILAMEEEIGRIPAWAVDVAMHIDGLPHCGQINFPEPIFAVCRGIGRERSDPRFMFCFEATSATKAHVGRYTEILEGWCQGQTQDMASSGWPDCKEFIQKAYASLGPSTELKRLLVERVILQCRFWIESLITHAAGVLTIHMERSAPTRQHSYDGRVDPAAEDQERRLRAVAEPRGVDIDAFLAEMAHPWLCHARLFDQIDVALERIGREESGYDRQEAHRDARDAANWMRRVYGVCVDALGMWLEGKEPEAASREEPETRILLANTYDVLGDRTAVKAWLATAFRKKMALFRGHDLEKTLAV